ncbi:MAG: hypothetical protein AB2A00_05965 [Myxococcota bacterium]
MKRLVVAMGMSLGVWACTQDCGAGLPGGLPLPGTNTSRPDANDTWKVTTPDPSVENWRGLWVAHADLAYVVGDRGAIARYENGNWTRVASGTEENLESVWGRDVNDIWAVGWNGTVLHSTGGDFTVMPTGITSHLFSVFGSNDVVFMVGAEGAILTPDADGGVRVMTDEVTLRSFPVCETRIENPAQNGGICTTYEIPGEPGVRYPLCGAPEECCVNPGGTCCYGQRCDPDGGPLIGSVRLDADLKSGWASGNFAVACGGGGAIYEWRDGDRGYAWYEMQLAEGVPFTRDSLVTAWGTSQDNVYCAGQDGRLMRREGGDWVPRSIPTPVYVQGLWGTGRRDIYAVGFSGVVLRYDGFGVGRDAGWYDEDIHVDNHLRAVGGARLDYDGGPRQTPDGGPPPARVWVVGSGGVILQKN